MAKMKRNVFLSLAVRMIGFGLFVGIFFPIFLTFFGIDKSIAFSLVFVIACVLAGIFVGVMNFLLAKGTVGKKLTVLKEKMTNVSNKITKYNYTSNEELCVSNDCLIEEGSEDEFGDCADAFNILVNSLVNTLQFQNQHRQFIGELSTNLELDGLSSFALKYLIEFSHADAGAILVEKEGELVSTASIGINDPESLKDNPILLEILKTSERKIIDLPEGVMLDGILTKYRPTQIVTEPIVFSNSVSGVVLLASSKEMDSVFLEQVDIFVHDFSLVLNNSLQHEQIQKLAALDPLTSIYNRRFGLSRLNEEFSRSLRTSAPLGTMMMDIDKFKMINDTYGHIAGDRFLKHLVAVVNPILREGDFLVRYGGEEFLAVLPGANKNDVFKVAERIRFAIAQSSIMYGESTISATISIGIDSMPETSIDDPLKLIGNSDHALYEAKRGGRNKTIIFEKVE